MKRTWSFAEEYNWENDKREKIESCFLGKIFYRAERRRHPEVFEIERYDGASAFSHTLQDAKDLVEDSREKGAFWTIVELPTIVCVGEKITLIICEINTSAPLEKYINSNLSDTTIYGIYKHFTPHKQDSVIRIICDKNCISPATLPFRKYESKSLGGKYLLRWQEFLSYTWKINPILEAIKNINLLMQEEKGFEIIV